VSPYGRARQVGRTMEGEKYREGPKMVQLEVCGGGTLIPPPTTSRPTDQAGDLLKYYALRVTLPHKQIGELQEVLSHYSKDYVIASHNADVEDKHEHFHLAMLDIETHKQVDAMKKALKKRFQKAGNAFVAGKFMDNHVYKALQYMKHDENVVFRHRGSHWQRYIDESPEWDAEIKTKKGPEKKKIESDPMLSFSNVLWRAAKHREEHNISSSDLGVTLEHMTRTTNWIPSLQMMRNGLDPLHFRLFEFRCNNRTGPTPDWWTPRLT